MTPFLSRGRMFALAAAAGCAFAPAAFAQNTAPSDQAVKSETVHSDAPDRHLAPHDTFYTMEYVSARTDKGVEGFPPGTEVHLVSVNREAHTLTVTDGHANIELPPDKLTNDMDIADMVRAKDTANQERIARYRQAEAAAYQKYQQEVADYTAKDLEKRQQAIRATDERLQEQAASSHTDQPAATTGSSYGNYYNQGNNGYGSPYGYFIDLNGTAPAVQNNRANAPAQNTITTQNGSNGKGGLSTTQNGTQSGNSRTGGSTSGTTSSTTGGGTGNGKK